MNPEDIPQANWLFVFFVRTVEYLNPLVHALGLGVAIWGFMRSRKRGYLIIGAYFGLVLFTMFVLPLINRSTDISEQTQAKIDTAVQRVLEEEGHPVMPARHSIRFPFGPVLLVAGVWLLARREKTPGQPATG
jgi:hypothetical protein